MKNFILITLLVTIFSCNTIERESKITDFENKYEDTLKPKKNCSYTAARYWIIGEVNDTIKVSFHGSEKYYFGKFQYDFFTDYYGMIDVEFKIDPYKATDGKIEVKYGIY